MGIEIIGGQHRKDKINEKAVKHTGKAKKQKNISKSLYPTGLVGEFDEDIE